MAEESGPPGWAIREVVVAQAERRWDADVGVQLFDELTGADYLSLAGLLLAWSGVVAIGTGEPNWGIVLTIGAFGFDKADGYYARRLGVASDFGRLIDSYVDAFVYLVTAATLYQATLSPGPVASIVVGFTLLAFGGLRLVRHASTGFGEAAGTSYYVGVTVVHANLVVVATYYADLVIPWWNGWVAAVPILIVCPLMISGYRSYKSRIGHALAAVAAGLAAGVSLWLEVGQAGVVP